MIKIKTAELIGAALDWAVAKIEGRAYTYIGDIPWFAPSTDWSQGGPIIEREKIELGWNEGWYANMFWRGMDIVPAIAPGASHRAYDEGPTALIAAMRCYVASELGDEVEIPEELLK